MVMMSVIDVYSLNKFFIYKDVLKINHKIEYTYLNKIKNSGGRGEHYNMRIKYIDAVYKISITNKMFDDIDKGILPELFITPQNEVISNWNMILAKRGVFITSLGVILCLLLLILLKRK